jgi:glycerophosphoryl diester phosphodiesterase
MITKLLQSDQHAYIAQAAAVNANAINPLFTTCTEKFVRLAGQKGLEVYPWTVDVVSRARDLIKWDVTGIITNKPELLIKELNA